MTTAKIQKQLKFRLHPKQLEIFWSTARYKIAECGRRFGKTKLAWIECLTYMIDHANCLLWWVAPYYKELIPATKAVRALTPHSWVEKKLETSEIIRYLRLHNGAEIYFHSADKEDSLRGLGLHGLVIDEAASMKEKRWTEELQPSLMDYHGWVIFIGTPKGTNWFSRLYQKGQDPNQTEYRSWRFSSYANAIEQGGFLKKSNIDAIANDLPEFVCRQEIYAEELEGEGVVFRNITRQIKQDIKPYLQGELICVGSDLAKHVDFTVNIAVRLNGEVVGFERYNQIDWPFQRKRIVEFSNRYGGASLLIDSTGLGDPIYDELSREYPNVQGYKLTNITKKELIENLSIMIDNGEVWFPGNLETKEFNDDMRVLQSELESFTYEILPSGLIRYGAPEGLHDDCVIALALAAWMVKQQRGFSVGVSFGERP